MKKTTALRITRWTILLSILVLTTVMSRLHQMIKLYPSIDAFCPFGGLESLWTLIRYNSLLRKVAISSTILLILSAGTALLFRRSFCGNICPLGFMQELFGSVGRFFFKKRNNLPPFFDKILRYLKYLVLVLILSLTWRALDLIIQPYDPWLAYHHIGSDELFSKYLIGSVILFASLGLGIFIDRPFCRYLCPMGGFLGLLSKIGLTSISRNIDTCIDCSICDENCPAGIKISQMDSVKSAECLMCGECVNICPVEKTLDFTIPGPGKRKISPAVIIFGTLGLFVLVIGITTYTKQFIWKVDTGLERNVERLLAGPGYIKKDNQPIHIVQIFQIHPLYLQDEFSIDAEEEFYMTFEELQIPPEDVEEFVNRLYEEAGLDPAKLMKGGGHGRGRGNH